MKAFALFLTLILMSTPSQAKSDKALYQELTDLVEEVDLTRSDLSQKTPKDVTAATYKPVCLKVAGDMRKIAKRKRFKFRNVSPKPRNPKNKPNKAEKQAIKKFQSKPHLASYWSRDEEGFWYFRQIKGEDQCMSCHGQTVPAFLRKKYQKDLAKGHKYGSFMGIYSIHIPDRSKK